MIAADRNELEAQLRQVALKVRTTEGHCVRSCGRTALSRMLGRLLCSLLLSRMRGSAHQIREKELSSFTENFAVLSTQSVFLAGLGVGGLTMRPVWNHNQMIFFQNLFYICITVSLGFNILTMCVTSWSMIFGPSLGIRGPPGEESFLFPRAAQPAKVCAIVPPALSGAACLLPMSLSLAVT